MLGRIKYVIAAITVSALLGIAVPISAAELSIVAEHGDPAPGFPAGVVFVRLGEPAIGAEGHLAFTGLLRGGEVTQADDNSIWTGKPGALQILVRAGDPAPGTDPGVVFDRFDDDEMTVTRTGQVAFFGNLRGPGVTSGNRRGLWMGTPGNLQFVARPGDEAPGLPGVFFDRIFGAAPTCTDGGCIFVALLSDSSSRGIWAGLPGALELVFRAGDAAPGVTPATTIRNFISSQPAINELGDIAIPAVRLASNNSNIVYFGKPGALSIFVSGGDTFPEIALDEFIFGTNIVNINNAGQLTFITSIGFPLPQQTGIDRSVWTGKSDNLRLLAREGQPVPDAPGFEFGSFIREPVIDGNGATLFESALRMPNSSIRNFALFRGRADSPIEMLASTVAGVPGFPGVPVNGLAAKSINAAGDAAFFTGGAAIDALWFGNPGNVDLVATPGITFDAGAKGIRTILGFIPTAIGGSAGNEDGHRSFLSDQGQVVFSAVIDSPRSTAILITAAPPPANSAPTVAAFAIAPSSEGQIVGFSADFSDSDTADVHVATVDWGDGSPADVFDPATSPVVTSHVYADDGTYTVTASVTDNAGDSGSASASAQIANRAPSVAAGNDQSVTVGDTIVLDPATFNDPGTLDTHIAVINWGDSSTDVVAAIEAPFGPPGSTAGLNGNVAANHVYTSPGQFSVTVTVTDDEGAPGLGTLTVDVADLAPLQCDIDGDRDVDRLDINAILAARNQPASGPDDPRDIDGNGLITVLDARKCAVQCTRARCATN